MDFNIILKNIKTRAVKLKKGQFLGSIWGVEHEGRTVKALTLESGPKSEVPCDGCWAPCCRFPNPMLNAEEFLTKKFPFQLMPNEGELKEKFPEAEFIITLKKNGNGPCIYFDEKNRKCKIYPECPKSCLTYDCREEKRSYIRNRSILFKKNKLPHSPATAGTRYSDVTSEKFVSLSHSSPPEAGYSASRNKKI